MPRRPLTGPAAWRGDSFSSSAEWVQTWSFEEIHELEDALRRARRSTLPLERIGPEDFPLHRVAQRLDSLRSELLSGRGFVLLRGLDLTKYTRAEVATVFWGIGAHLGRAVPQNAAGDLLGHVTDLGRDARDPNTRIYQTNERQGFHTDSADLVGLLCLQPARVGGRSSLASCAALYNEMLESAPELLAELFGPFCTDHRGEYAAGASPYFEAPILSWFADELSVLYQRHYIESAQRFESVAPLTDSQTAALDAFDRAADDPAIHVEMELQRGDIQLLHNHQVIHDRTAFRDWPQPDRRRHLLRLWLCPRDGRPLPPWFAQRLGSVAPGARGGVVLDGVDPVISLHP